MAALQVTLAKVKLNTLVRHPPKGRTRDAVHNPVVAEEEDPHVGYGVDRCPRCAPHVGDEAVISPEGEVRSANVAPLLYRLAAEDVHAALPCPDADNLVRLGQREGRIKLVELVGVQKAMEELPAARGHDEVAV